MTKLCCGIALSVVLGVGAASAADLAPLTEGEALRLALGRPEVGEVARGMVGVAQAEATAVGLPPNPALDFKRDDLNGSPNKVEQTIQISQTFDIAGRRTLRREAADRRVQAVHGEAQARQIEHAAELRRRFFEALLRQDLADAVDAWARRFARIEAIVGKLARGGEVSGYDSRRLARERMAAQARLEVERAELERAREQLSSLLGGNDALGQGRRLAGTLLPAAASSIEALLPRIKARPGLKALEERAAAADLDGRAASRGWIPNVTLGAGPKYVDNGSQRDSGIAFLVSIPLPVFDREQAGGQRAASQALLARGEYGLALSRAEGDLRGLWKLTERLRTAAVEYRGKAVASSADLTRIAEVSYQAGEATLLELLDAYRGALDAEMTALDLEWKSRLARIELDQLTGVPEQ